MNEEPSTKLTLENEYGTYTIEVPKTDMTVIKMFEDMVEPLLLAAGYQPGSIARYLGDE